MEREQIKNEQEEDIYQILDNSIILNFETIKFLIVKGDWDALILFIIYSYISKLQKNTNKIWASNEFTRKIWKCRKQKLLKTKARIKNEYKIIKLEPLKDASKRIKKWLIWLKPLLNSELIKEKARGSQARGSRLPPVEFGNHSSMEDSMSSIEDNNTNTEELKNKTPLNSFLKEKFVLFWEIYPKKKAKYMAEKAWHKLKPSPELIQTILKDIKNKVELPDWQKDDGQFIPYPSTYLNQKRWTDEVDNQPNSLNNPRFH